MKKLLLLLPLIAATLTTDASAVAVLVNNHSFELDGLADGDGTPTAPSNWTMAPVSGNSQAGADNPHDNVYDGTTGPLGFIPGGDGLQNLYVNSYQVDHATFVYQNVGALLPDTLYTLTVAIGNRKDFDVEPGVFSLVNGTDHLGATLVFASGKPITAGLFEDFSVQISTGSTVSGDLIIVLSNPNSSATIGGLQSSFDNIRLDAATVPEPSAAIALLTGIASLCGLRRFRLSGA